MFLAVRLRTVKLWSKTDPLSVWRTVSSNWVSDTRMRALALVIRAVPPRTRSRERGALVVSAVSPPRQRMSVSSSAPFLERKAAEESAVRPDASSAAFSFVTERDPAKEAGILISMTWRYRAKLLQNPWMKLSSQESETVWRNRSIPPSTSIVVASSADSQ